MSDPRARLVALFLLGAGVLALEGPAPLGVVAGGSVAALILHPQAAGWRLRVVGLALLVAWTTAVSQALFYAGWPRTPLLRLGPLTFWREGALYGLAQSLRFVAVLAAGAWVSVSTPPDRMLAALVALRVPYGLALMAATVVRFVPAVGAEWVVVRAARARRGRPAWRRSLWAWLQLEASLLRPVVARAVRRARALAESLEARGFHPTAPRTEREPLRLGMLDAAVVGALGILVAALMVARVLYVAYGAEILYRPELRPLYAFVREWL